MDKPKALFGTSVAGLYFLIQGILIAAWWYLLLQDESLQEMFFSDRYRFGRSRDVFFAGDMFILVPVSILAAVLCLRRATFAPYIAYAAAGASWYAGFMELGINAPIGSQPLADVSMVLCALGSTWAAWRSTAG